MTNPKVLLINGKQDKHWIELLRRAVKRLEYTLDLADHGQLNELSFQRYELVVLDSRVVVDLKETIETILADNPLARVIVISPAPHWKQSREALEAGALDYTTQEYGEDAIFNLLRENLLKTIRFRPIQPRKEDDE